MLSHHFQPSTSPPVVDVVIIGRNEGKRQGATIRSVGEIPRRVIYVDSGSTDDSIAIAERFDVQIINLDMSVPFTAARARNAGLAEIQKYTPLPDFIQFIDGDCSLSPDWLELGLKHLDGSPRTGAVCGRRREKFPEASVYNLMCDWEWNTPVGPTSACGGDMLVRYCAIASVNGYREDVIAAEDNEICRRIAQKGWELHRLDADMTHHDADMHTFSQWWKRAVRAGHGFAQVGDLHPGYFGSERRRVWFWSVWVPSFALLTVLVWPPLLLTSALLYVASYLKCLRIFRRVNFSWSHGAVLALLLVISKFPNLQGMLTWRLTRARQLKPTIIEYK